MVKSSPCSGGWAMRMRRLSIPPVGADPFDGVIVSSALAAAMPVPRRPVVDVPAAGPMAAVACPADLILFPPASLTFLF